MSCGIYRFQNQITLESYVGQSICLEERYNRHRRDWLNGTTDFYEGIQEWGWDNFSYEVLELCKKDELNEKEIYWIAYYDSFRNGYNETKGGSNRWTVNIDKIIELYHNGYTPKQIKEELQIGLSTVYKYLSCDAEFIKNKNKSSADFYVYQYNLDGSFIRSWPSRKAVQRNLNINATAIGKVITGERVSAGQFLWRDYFMEQLPKEQLRSNWHKNAVNQYDKDLNYIQTFDSYASAARSINGDSSLIKRVCSKGTKYSAYGYKWILAENDNITPG